MSRDAGSVPALPAEVVAVSDALRNGLERVLGDGFASLFLYGAVAFARPASWTIDFDFSVLLHRALTDADRDGIATLYRALAGASELGADLDGYYVLLADAAGAEPPRHQLDLSMRDDAWALHRAHVRAGRYVLVAGLDPREILVEPTWSELETALRAELRFVETHPEARAYGILNGARILYSFETHNVVVSKFHAAQWALESLSGEWHAAVRTAMRAYERTAIDGDERTLEEHWAPFVSYVKRSLPR